MGQISEYYPHMPDSPTFQIQENSFIQIDNALEARNTALEFLSDIGGISNNNKLDFKNIQFINGLWHLLIVYRAQPKSLLSKTINYQMVINPHDGEIMAFY